MNPLRRRSSSTVETHNVWGLLVHRLLHKLNVLLAVLLGPALDTLQESLILLIDDIDLPHLLLQCLRTCQPPESQFATSPSG